RLTLLPEAPVESAPIGAGTPNVILHPKYLLPASCFGYVGDASQPHTWHLPYLLSNHAVDPKRHPKAIQAILSNYRGARVTAIPEAAIPDVLVRLARAASNIGKMPPAQTSAIYGQLAAVLEQLGRAGEVGNQ